MTPPAATEPVAAAEPESPAAESTDPTDPLLQRLETELGFTGIKDRADAEERWFQYTLDQKRQAEEAAAWRRDNEQLVGYGREYLAAREQPKPQQAQAEPPKPWQAPVEYPDQLANRYLTKDAESGQTTFKPDTPASARAEIESYVAWRDGLVDMLASRPDQFIKQILIPLIDERSKGVIEPFYNERTAEQQAKSYYAQVAEENADWLYAKDPRTQQATQQFSERGKLFDQRIGYYQQFGMPPQEAVRLAKRDVDEQVQAAPAPVPSPAAAAEQRRREHVNGARKNAVPRNRVGSYPQPGERRPQNENEFGTDFVQELLGTAS